MTKSDITDIATGRNGKAGFLLSWWNPYIYNLVMRIEKDRETYLRLSIEYVFAGISERNTNFWIDQMDKFGIPHQLKKIEIEKEPQY